MGTSSATCEVGAAHVVLVEPRPCPNEVYAWYPLTGTGLFVCRVHAEALDRANGVTTVVTREEKS